MSTSSAGPSTHLYCTENISGIQDVLTAIADELKRMVASSRLEKDASPKSLDSVMQVVEQHKGILNSFATNLTNHKLAIICLHTLAAQMNGELKRMRLQIMEALEPLFEPTKDYMAKLDDLAVVYDLLEIPDDFRGRRQWEKIFLEIEILHVLQEACGPIREITSGTEDSPIAQFKATLAELRQMKASDNLPLTSQSSSIVLEVMKKHDVWPKSGDLDTVGLKMAMNLLQHLAVSVPFMRSRQFARPDMGKEAHDVDQMVEELLQMRKGLGMHNNETQGAQLLLGKVDEVLEKERRLAKLHLDNAGLRMDLLDLRQGLLERRRAARQHHAVCCMC